MNSQLHVVEEENTLRAVLSAEPRDDTLIAQLLSIPLPHTDSQSLVTWLKQEADAAWYRDPRRTLANGELIYRVGEVRGDRRQMALGMMTQGDALRFLNRAADAWEKLEQAGELFLSARDSFGWARTRIGRLGLSTELGVVEVALSDANRARNIFTEFGDQDMLLRLDLNTAVVYDLKGDHVQALVRYRQALESAAALKEQGERYLPILYTNMGYASTFLGDFRGALDYYGKARAHMLARGETSGIVNIDLALAYIALGQGRYKRALSLLHGVIERAADQLPKEASLARREMVECYLPLNQFQKARDLAMQVIGDYERAGAAHDRARTLLLLAEAQAHLGDLDSARTALDEAEQIFADLNAKPWQSTARMRRGQIALQQGDCRRALQDAQEAANIFAASQRPFDHAEALLLRAQSELADGHPLASAQIAQKALALVRHRSPALSYGANLLLGRAALALGKVNMARRRFQIAVSEIERAQQQLTITFRSSFIENRVDALHALIRLCLREGQVADAFASLERAKSLTLLTYLNGRDELRWHSDDERTRALIDELSDLRAEHHWYYRIAHEQIDQRERMEASEAAARLADCEQRIRAITEKLYLLSASPTDALAITPPALADIQAALPSDAALLEFYADEREMWAFVVKHDSITVHPLPLTSETVSGLVERMQLNINRALRLGADSRAPQAQLTVIFDGIAAQLYSALIAPAEMALSDCKRLYVVPYGSLHYLPFHLLRSANGYLIDTHEVVTLPSAALLTRSTSPRAGDSVILTHSWDGKLPQTRAEAAIVARHFTSNTYHDGDAQRDVLSRTPGALLHIAAHGAFRMEEPDFSFMQLAGDPLFMDDLLQYDLSYELVTLSACETGRARVAPGDELIGLGQGFLYGGAGALIASLWRIEDGTTLALMDHLYRALRAGQSKAGALREAQLAARDGLHPAFWGAFVLIGSPNPISV